MPCAPSYRNKSVFLLLSAALIFIISLKPGHARDYLTDKEIELLQETRSIANRTRIYMDAAARRLQTTNDKLFNKEYDEGDPMELLLPEEAMDDYCKIMHSVQLNISYAIEAPKRTGNESIGKALKILKNETEKSLRMLETLQKIAHEKQRDALSVRIQDAIEITQETLDDAAKSLADISPIKPADK